ncbi:MAG: DUF2058 domain-containing protein [Desulfopila sp.]|jgi:uncharacterized protein YaiL (DUF2058 family)|nr:DUF2058 domain-containing protein [Desulfopila sp.]
MGKTLQEQLLQMGLIDKKKYQQSKKETHAQKKVPQKQENEIAEMAKQALAQKKLRDQQLNKKKIAQREAKEATAKARQLIETHKIQVDQGDIPYNFKHENTIKKIYLPKKTIESLVNGKIGIVKLAGQYQFVPADIIYKIRNLNGKMVVLFNVPTEKKDGETDDDPYAAYTVPDDLMW